MTTYRKQASMTLDGDVLRRAKAAAEEGDRNGCATTVLELLGYWLSWRYFKLPEALALVRRTLAPTQASSDAARSFLGPLRATHRFVIGLQVRLGDKEERPQFQSVDPKHN